MRLLPTLLLLASILALALTPALAAKREKVPLDAPPRLISTESDGPKQWKNTKQLRAHAAQGDPLACFELGTRLLDGDDEVPADLAQARVLLETAAKGGIGDAQFRLGKIYHDARGVHATTPRRWSTTPPPPAAVCRKPSTTSAPCSSARAG